MAQVWNLPGPDRLDFVRRLARGLAFLGVLGSGLVVSAFLAGFGTFGQHPLALGLLGELLALSVNVTQYLLAFRVLTPKAVPTPRLVPGAVVGGIALDSPAGVGGLSDWARPAQRQCHIRAVRHGAGADGVGLSRRRDQHLRGGTEHGACPRSAASAPCFNRLSPRPTGTRSHSRPGKIADGPRSASRSLSPRRR